MHDRETIDPVVAIREIYGDIERIDSAIRALAARVDELLAARAPVDAPAKADEPARRRAGKENKP